MDETRLPDWRQRLEAAESEWLRRRTTRAALRRELDVARQAGLRARHQAKLARGNRRGEVDTEKRLNKAQRADQEKVFPQPGNSGMGTNPPCCAEAAEPPCPQHRQAARVVRHEGPRNRSERGHAVVGEPGRAKPAPVEEKP